MQHTNYHRSTSIMTTKLYNDVLRQIKAKTLFCYQRSNSIRTNKTYLKVKPLFVLEDN